MKGLLAFLFLCLLAVQSAMARSSQSDLRKALSSSPMFSHKREGQVPQNVNIFQPVQESVPKKQEAASTHVIQEAPMSLPVVPSNTLPTSGQPKQGVFGRQDQVQQQQQPAVQSGRRVNVNPVINDRMADRVRVQPRRRQNTGNRRQQQHQQQQQQQNPNSECPFNSPSFIFTETNITQVEFEQKYLLPALRAHLIGNCNSRPMTIYLDWLLYLRERLFNV